MNAHRAIPLALALLVGSAVDAANLTVSPTSHDFGSVPFGQRKTATIRVENDGVVQRKVPVKSSSPHITVNDTSLVIQGKRFVNLIVVLGDKTPPGAQSATITIDDGKDEIRVSVRAKVEAPPPTPKPTAIPAAPSLSVNPASLDFGTLELNQSKTQTFTLTGTQSAACQLRSQDTATMVVTPTTVSLTPNQPVTVSVTFTAKFELQLRGNPKGSLATKATVTCGSSKAAVDLKGATPVPRRLNLSIPSLALNGPGFFGGSLGTDLLYAGIGGKFINCQPGDDRGGSCAGTPLAGANVEVKVTCPRDKKPRWTVATGSASSCLGSTNPVCGFVINADSTLNATCGP